MKLEGETFSFHRNMGTLLQKKFLSEKDDKIVVKTGGEEAMDKNNKVAMNFKEFDFIWGKIQKKQQYYITELARLPEGKL
jgi:hypothetical protein